MSNSSKQQFTVTASVVPSKSFPGSFDVVFTWTSSTVAIDRPATYHVSLTKKSDADALATAIMSGLHPWFKNPTLVHDINGNSYIKSDNCPLAKYWKKDYATYKNTLR